MKKLWTKLIWRLRWGKCDTTVACSCGRTWPTNSFEECYICKKKLGPCCKRFIMDLVFCRRCHSKELSL